MGKILSYLRSFSGVEPDTNFQRTRIKGFALAHGWTVEGWFEDISDEVLTPMMERERGQELANQVRPGDIIIAYSAEAISNSATDFVGAIDYFTRKKVQMFLVQETLEMAPVATDMARKLAARFELGEKRRSLLLSRARREKEDKGQFAGGRVPFGWKRDEEGKLVAEPSQQEAIREMRRLRGQGFSYRSIEAKMAEHGFKVSHQSVKAILAYERNQ
ncbi:MAG: recombinase family protein [Devosia sp.]|uniref:recombinase family protein n=1 Tax=Devosia sp. TaxID=1871048 RepID=UPI001A079FF1|nr:recombinase family protein [Devosia sp.]MBF0678796.1 recombinase family protein [Devosia sp.]